MLIVKQQQNTIKYNLLFSVAVVFMIYIGDLFLMLTGRSHVVFPILTSIIILAACFALSFCNKYIKILIATVVIIPIAINLNCITYFEAPITVDQIYAALKNNDDVFDAFSYVWFIEPFIIIPYVLVIFLSFFYDKRYYKSTFAMLLLFYGFYWIYILAARGGYLYPVPVKTRISVVNSFRTFPWIIIHYSAKPDNDFPEAVKKPYEIKLVNKNTPRIIFLIWGESTNVDYLSLFGESRFIQGLNTTPELEKIILEQKNNYTVMKSVSSSYFTEPSTTLFFNLLHTPGNLFEIAKGNKQNLFTLAKENGYKTHWLSVSATNIMSTGGMPADNVITKDTHVVLPESQRDDYLLEQIKKLDLSDGKHFVVVQFHSLHERYDDNYGQHKDQFEYFKPNKNDDRRTSSRKRYINNVLYLDYLLSETINFAKQNDADYIFYTADHGECIGTDLTGKEDGDVYGHGSIGRCSAIVPFVMYQKKPDLFLKRWFEQQKITTHYEISSAIARVLGYNVKRPNEEKDVFFIYASFPARKNINVIKLKRRNGEFTQLYNGTILDYFIQTYNFKPKKV